MVGTLECGVGVNGSYGSCERDNDGMFASGGLIEGKTERTEKKPHEVAGTALVHDRLAVVVAGVCAKLVLYRRHSSRRHIRQVHELSQMGHTGIE